MAPGAADHDWELEAGIVRPYLFTGGRTEPTVPALAVEALVGATPAGRAAEAGLPAERRRILTRCRRPTSVAELAAYLGLPIGVVRVLVADLYAEGYVRIHATARTRNGRGGPADDLALLRRLVDHVRAIPV